MKPNSGRESCRSASNGTLSTIDTCRTDVSSPDLAAGPANPDANGKILHACKLSLDQSKTSWDAMREEKYRPDPATQQGIRTAEETRFFPSYHEESPPSLVDPRSNQHPTPPSSLASPSSSQHRRHTWQSRIRGFSFRREKSRITCHRSASLTDLSQHIATSPLKRCMTVTTLDESLNGTSSLTRMDNLRCSKRDMMRSVSFDRVEIREYEITLGDNPSVTTGPPISLGWKYDPKPDVMDLNEYEGNRPCIRDSTEFRMPRSVREEKIRAQTDCSRGDIAQAIREVRKAKNQRRRSVVNMEVQPLEEAVEGARRKLKKIVTGNSTKKEEIRLWEQAQLVSTEKARAAFKKNASLTFSVDKTDLEGKKDTQHGASASTNQI